MLKGLIRQHRTSDRKFKHSNAKSSNGRTVEVKLYCASSIWIPQSAFATEFPPVLQLLPLSPDTRNSASHNAALLSERHDRIVAVLSAARSASCAAALDRWMIACTRRVSKGSVVVSGLKTDFPALSLTSESSSCRRSRSSCNFTAPSKLPGH